MQQSPEATESCENAGRDTPPSKNADRLVRFTIYTHVLAVGFCGLFSYWDRQRVMWEQFPTVLLVVIYPLFFWAIFSLFLYPFIIAGLIVVGRVRRADIAKVLILEVVLVNAQLFALLPAVQ
jgi:hypothetical protein